MGHEDLEPAQLHRHRGGEGGVVLHQRHIGVQAAPLRQFDDAAEQVGRHLLLGDAFFPRLRDRFGDPAFDVGFLINHLVLKSIAMPEHRSALAGLAEAFLEGLSATLPHGADWIPAAGFQHLPALLLARVAGKSPAEYLDCGMKTRVATLARDLMRIPAATTQELFQR